VLEDIELNFSDEQMEYMKYKYLDLTQVRGNLNYDDLLKDISDLLSTENKKPARP
jgi:hypothetical protein